MPPVSSKASLWSHVVVYFSSLDYGNWANVNALEVHSGAVFEHANSRSPLASDTCTLCRQCPDAIGQVGCLEVEIEQQQQSLVTTGGKTNKESRTKSQRWEAASADSFNHFYVGFHSFTKKFFVHGSCRGQTEATHSETECSDIDLHTDIIF